MLYNNNISLFVCSLFEFPTIADLVRNRVYRGDNQSVGVRYLMIHQVLADDFDQPRFFEGYIEYHLQLMCSGGILSSCVLSGRYQSNIR